MHHQTTTTNTTTRRTATPSKPNPTTQFKSPHKPPLAAVDSPVKKLARRRSVKPPEPDPHPTPLKPSLSAPPNEEDSPELSPEIAAGDEDDVSELSPEVAAGDEEEEEVEEKGSDAFDDKEMDLAEDDKRIDQIYVVPVTGGSPEKEADGDPPPEIDPILEKATSDDDCEVTRGSMQGTEKQMQRIVDLVMWSDMSRSALVFGMGTFFFISCSYTRDLNFSIVSAMSYVGLFYLAGIFLFNLIFRRGEVDYGKCNERWLVGEDEALVVIKVFLPYVNEILIKLRALFSGDPATTMKMAMLLFALARCGGSITFWTMGKLAFFGMFTIPRFLASYSSHISRYGTFWLERFKDAWDSCTHKKAAAATTFIVVWNLSSNSARSWLVFMLAVALRYYQQCAWKDWSYPVEDEINGENDCHEKIHPDQRRENDKHGDGCGKGRSPATEASRRRQAAAAVAALVGEKPKGLNGPRQRLRSGPDPRCDKEKKKS